MSFLADWWFATFAIIFFLILACIIDPNGAVNTFMIMLIDLVKGVFPDTPQGMTIASWVTSFQQSYPMIGGEVLVEVINGVLGMISLLMIFKIWKLLPFV
ncbi:hypothetical protein [Pseudanabaena yagii]|uniref:Uncharacterized protein n=1 Tax=Pseudanabaena yagii GIHE-NHR1 TaxID=2722753 RepID=A0ABX1LQV2_9CYAN|nr:hypothetical protein [Pseudanabaena yagii]NMF57105.1 hypothetical protein [Pseudanabaena yagii GIHE-NHR1]NMF57880.1 hypothetical protein [Pseudanabaena yagii GIHE-NHR1]